MQNWWKIIPHNARTTHTSFFGSLFEWRTLHGIGWGTQVLKIVFLDSDGIGSIQHTHKCVQNNYKTAAQKRSEEGIRLPKLESKLAVERHRQEYRKRKEEEESSRRAKAAREAQEELVQEEQAIGSFTQATEEELDKLLKLATEAYQNDNLDGLEAVRD